MTIPAPIQSQEIMPVAALPHVQASHCLAATAVHVLWTYICAMLLGSRSQCVATGEQVLEVVGGKSVNTLPTALK